VKKLYDTYIKAGIPANVVLEVTYRCNLKCIHCYVVNRGENELTFEEYSHLLDDLNTLGTLILTVTGGEPLVRRDIRDLLEMMSEKEFAIRLFTAGYYIDEDFAHFLSQLNILEVELSIYGSRSELHDSITGVRGSFDHLVRAVKFLRKHNIKVNLKFIAMKPNYRDVVSVKELVHSLDANFYYDVVITPKDDLSIDPLKLRLDLYQLREFYSLVKDRPYIFPQRDVNEYICNAGLSTMAISPYGDVYPCVQLRLLAGNIREKSIVEIWKKSEVFKSLRGKRIKDYRCGSCPLLPYCSPCIGSIWLEKGDVNGCTEILRNRAVVLKELADEK